jgi:hypothetical protein
MQQYLKTSNLQNQVAEKNEQLQDIYSVRASTINLSINTITMISTAVTSIWT